MLYFLRRCEQTSVHTIGTLTTGQRKVCPSLAWQTSAFTGVTHRNLGDSEISSPFQFFLPNQRLTWRMASVCVFLVISPLCGKFFLGRRPSLSFIFITHSKDQATATTTHLQSYSTRTTFEVCYIFSRASAIAAISMLIIHQG